MLRSASPQTIFTVVLLGLTSFSISTSEIRIGLIESEPVLVDICKGAINDARNEGGCGEVDELEYAVPHFPCGT